MKTYLDEFNLNYTVIQSADSTILLKVTLTHSFLPIIFSYEKEYKDDKDSRNKSILLELINYAYTQLYLCYKYGKSCEPIINSYVHIYTGEYDNEKEAWFVLDSLGNRCYTEEEINLEKNRLLKV